MTDEEFNKRSEEDFKFMVICNMKGRMDLYALLRDREYIEERNRRAEAQRLRDHFAGKEGVSR